MFTVAIVDDEPDVIRQLQKMLQRYGETAGEDFKVYPFSSPDQFLYAFASHPFDICLLDIQMPGKNGMDTAREIRKTSEDTEIVFVTNMAQYAIEGYQVGAYRYLLKPVTYTDFTMTLSGLVHKLHSRLDSPTLTVAKGGNFDSIFIKDILYVEINVHRATYHLMGKQVTSWESMKSIEEKLAPYGFARCNACYLVNMKYVESIAGYDLKLMNGETLTISQSKKKSFVVQLTAFLGGA